MSTSMDSSTHPAPKTNGWKVFGLTIIILGVILAGFWLIKSYLFPSEFTPVSLSVNEAKQLNQKLKQLNLPLIDDVSTTSTNNKQANALEPEAYTEAGASREIEFSEREINAMIAHNTDMADKLAIDLSDSLASAKLLMPLDPDMPLFGGKTLNLKAGIELAFSEGKPIVKLRGVSAWGVPVPNAWMGNLKNIDLVSEFGDSGFWKSLADGIDYLQIVEGKLIVKLKE